MTFEADLKAWLQADAGITALVDDRITPQPLPQGTTKPAITYLIVAEDPQSDLDGEDGALLEVRPQIDCWALNQADVRALAELVRERMKTASFSPIPVPGSSFGDYEPQTKQHRFSRDFTCWHRLT